jgi:hypothetical protein
VSAIVEGKKKIILAGTAALVEEDRELAWTQPHIRRQPDLKWIVGNYVQADVANSNGHIFPLEDLQHSIESIPNKALNVVHVPHRVVGHFVAAEMIGPSVESADDDAFQTPVVEALAAFYSYYFPELLPSMEMAHKEGQLFYSMESVPAQVTCKGKGSFEGCGKTFDYDGRTSETYCDHLNEIAARKVLHKPHFTAGALIIPPIKPGWKRAEIKEISALLSEESDSAEQTYNEVAEMSPHLGPESWERIMTFLLRAAN